VSTFVELQRREDKVINPQMTQIYADQKLKDIFLIICVICVICG